MSPQWTEFYVCLGIAVAVWGTIIAFVVVEMTRRPTNAELMKSVENDVQQARQAIDRCRATLAECRAEYETLKSQSRETR